LSRYGFCGISSVRPRGYSAFFSDSASSDSDEISLWLEEDEDEDTMISFFTAIFGLLGYWTGITSGAEEDDEDETGLIYLI